MCKLFYVRTVESMFGYPTTWNKKLTSDDKYWIWWYHRQLAYDDFIAVAEDLIARGVTSPKHLGVRGTPSRRKKYLKK